jgi:hypothetical protein
MMILITTAPTIDCKPLLFPSLESADIFKVAERGMKSGLSIVQPVLEIVLTKPKDEL